MSYNWKCCSFYPNDFGASALYDDGEDFVCPSLHLLVCQKDVANDSASAQ
jgi:hypothetical protein